ncbi:MAG: HEAT repeat domain-containing protein, partial [Nitrospirae bacterium]
GGVLAKKIILDEIKGSDFINRGYEEKKELLEALCNWPDPDTEELIIGFFKKRGFFKRSRYQELNALAAHCLGILGTDRALEVLRKNRNNKNPLVQENIVKAIKRIEDARKG